MKRSAHFSPIQWRSAFGTFSYWMGGNFVVENPRTGTALSANPVTVRVLHAFADWRSFEEACRQLPEFSPPSIRSAIRQLVKHGLLLSKGSRKTKPDQTFRDTWSSWSPHASVLHFGTKDMPYTTSSDVTIRRMRMYLKQSPQPAPFRSLSSKLSSRKQILPPCAPADSPFFRTLMARRTHRDFSSQPLRLKDLSTLLRYTWGVTGFLNDWLLGDLPFKTSPSAGARHPCEVYVLAQKVEALPAGLYHYASDRHFLRPIREKTTRHSGVQYCAGQAWVKDAAALFLITAVFPRSMWKYRFPRAYRTVLADAAHLCQTFCLVATFLRLAPFCTMALKDSLIERDLGIDGINESALYVAGVGYPLPQYSG